MPISIRHLQATGIYRRIDLDQYFQTGINILYGENGAGKTLLLHILANALNGQYDRFIYLPFESILIELNDETTINITQISNKSDTEIQVLVSKNGDIEKNSYSLKSVEEAAREERSLPGSARKKLASAKNTNVLMQTAYFPAFRTMIEAWKTSSLSEQGIVFSEESMEQTFYRPNRRLSATSLSRELFGQFVPLITYPSPFDISDNLSSEYQNAAILVGNTTKKLFSQAFLEIFTTLAEGRKQEPQQSESILRQIQSIVTRLEKSALEEGSMPEGEIVAAIREKMQTFQFRNEEERLAADILGVYSNSLEEIAQVQEHAFENIRRYLEAVNGFLLRKNLIIQSTTGRINRPRVLIRFDDGSLSGLQALSSGERQIVTMIYAASRMSEQKLVLIDEPELSLHVDWQRLLLKKMSEQIQERQVIVCTHSPIG